MRHLLLAFWLLMLPAPVAAQWRYAENADGALAWVHTAAGSSLSLRCQPGAAQAGRMRVELIVWPTNTREPTEEVARIAAGRYTFSLEVEPEGPAFVNRRLYAGRYDYDDPVMVNFRAQLAGASVAVLEDAFDFRGDRFGLRGSRAAISQLEAACPRVWSRGSAGAPRPAATAPAPRWRVAGDGLSATVEGPGGTRFGIGCAPFGRVADLHWMVDLPIRGTLPSTNPTVTGRASDGTPIPFGEAMDNSGGEYDLRRPYPYVISFRPGPRETFLQVIARSAAWIDIAQTATTQAVRVSLADAEAAVTAVLGACGYGALFDAPSTTAGPGASPVPPEAIDSLRAYVASLVATSCQGGSAPSLPDGTLQVAGDRVTVNVNAAQCVWVGGGNPYCNGQLCQVWVYRWDGGSFTLIEHALR